MKSIIFTMALLVALLASACSKRQSDPTNRQTTSENASSEATLEDLNSALRTWMVRNPYPPSSVEQLAAAPWCGKALPKPPEGKQFVIDTRQMRVVLTNH